MKWMEKFQKIFMAASFAEAGEWDTARSLINWRKRRMKKSEKRDGLRKKPRARIYRT